MAIKSKRLLTLSASILASTAVLTGFALAASTAPDEVRLMPKWKAMDVNGDGKVSLDELMPAQAGAMRRVDLDKDGLISLAEYVANDLDPGGSARIAVGENVTYIPDLPYAATADPRQQVDVYIPKTPSVAGPLPVIAFFHGGGWSSGSKIASRSQTMDLVNSGRYAVVSVGYRLSWQDSWPAQIYDAKAAIRWIRANAKKYGFDPSRICAMGPSAGGHIVAQLGTTNGDPTAEGKLGKNLKQSSNVECVVDFMGPADLRPSAAASAGRSSSNNALLGSNPADWDRLAADASPLLHVKAGAPPFLIVHGSKDGTVNYQDSVKLDAALRQAGVPVIFQTIEGGGHGDFGAALPEVNRRVRAFLEHSFYDPTIVVPSNTLQRGP